MQFDKIIDVPVCASCRFSSAGCEETVELPQLRLVEKSLFPDVQVVQFSQTSESLGTARCGVSLPHSTHTTPHYHHQKSIAGGLDGWAWNEIKALPLPWLSGLAILLKLVEASGVWPQGLLAAYIAMIPKVDGDPTPLRQRPLSVLRWCTGCGLPFGLDICGSGLRGGCLRR